MLNHSLFLINCIKKITFISLLTFSTMLIYWTYEILISWSLYMAQANEFSVHRRYRHFIGAHYFWFSTSFIIILSCRLRVNSYFEKRNQPFLKLLSLLSLLSLVPLSLWMGIFLTCLMIRIGIYSFITYLMQQYS